MTNVPGSVRTHEVLQFEQVEADENGVGCSDSGAWDIVQEPTQAFKDSLDNSPDWDDDGMLWEDEHPLLANTRSTINGKKPNEEMRRQCRQLIDESRPLISSKEAAKSRSKVPVMSASLQRQKPLSTWIGRQELRTRFRHLSKAGKLPLWKDSPMGSWPRRKTMKSQLSLGIL